MLITHESNRLEDLALAFARLHRLPLQDSFDPEIVVLQNYGMARWLSLQLADQLKIAAHLEFLFPAEFMWGLLRRVLAGLPETAPFQPGVLVWRILDILEKEGDKFPQLAGYLADADSVRRFGLAKQLERIYDKYLFYRPDWISRWERGEEQHWQAQFWRLLKGRSRAVHWIELQTAFLERLQSLAPEQYQQLPQRVSFFGLAELSPGYLRLIKAVSEYLDIHFFLLNPCRQYWGDIVSQRQKLAAPEAVAPFLEVGNPLLASWGRQGRDFFDLLEGLGKDQTGEFFQDPGRDTLLRCLQSDILDLNDRTANPASAAIANSLAIHSCHTPMRELEVLHDQLLYLFESDSRIQPGDIVVMTPNLDQYAPYIDAVFATHQPKIPYALADRALLTGDPLAEILTAVLELPASRFEVNRLLALLDYEPVRQQAGLSEEDLARIARWCKETRIRWGIDKAMRERLALPATSENTWRQGLRRLLLGAVFDSDQPFGDDYPYPEVEGSLAVMLGRFVAWAEKLFVLQDWQEQKRPLTDWLSNLENLLNYLVGGRETLQESRQRLRDHLQALWQQAEQAGYEQPIDFPLFHKQVLNLLSSQLEQARYLTGRVTFCALTPMRSVPFKVVYLIGMNDREFPRPEPRYSFDRSAGEYRRGDRSQRVEDRYLFLESLLAARDYFYLSYVGQSVRDNSPLPPSVLVSELLDYIERGYDISRQQLVLEHPLQGFSHRYLGDDSRLFTYRDFYLEETESSARPFLSRPLPMPDPPKQLSITELIDFWRHPVRWFCRERLGVNLRPLASILPERESFSLERADMRRIRQLILAGLEAGDCGEKLEKRLRAHGMLPHGKAGSFLLAQQTELVGRLREAHAKEAVAEKTIRVEAKLSSGTRVMGSLDHAGGQGRLLLVLSEPYINEWIQFWLEHLLMCVQFPRPTTVIYPDKNLALKQEILTPVAEPMPVLDSLYDGFLEGHTRPLHWFPRSGFGFAETFKSKQDTERALRKAKEKWCGNDHSPGEKQDPYHRLAFKDERVLDEEFIHWGESVWTVLWRHREAKK